MVRIDDTPQAVAEAALIVEAQLGGRGPHGMSLKKATFDVPATGDFQGGRGREEEQAAAVPVPVETVLIEEQEAIRRVVDSPLIPRMASA